VTAFAGLLVNIVLAQGRTLGWSISEWRNDSCEMMDQTLTDILTVP